MGRKPRSSLAWEQKWLAEMEKQEGVAKAVQVAWLTVGGFRPIPSSVCTGADCNTNLSR